MARRAVTRREALNLSARLFATNGYKASSLELVAERLGVTRQALYYHFKNKGQILAALFDEVMTKLESAVAAVPVDQVVDSEPRFVAMMRAHVDVTVSNTDLVSVLLHERAEMVKIKDLHANKRRRDYAQLFIAAYADGVAAGYLKDIDPWIAVNTLISAVNGVTSWYQGERVAGNSESFKDTVMRLLGEGYQVTVVPVAV
jgi:AcrR family transcriptional regulator